MKLHVHNYSMFIYIQFKFYENPSIGYVAMAKDRKRDELKDRKKHWTYLQEGLSEVPNGSWLFQI